MLEMWVQSLGWEDPLEKGMATTPVFLPGESYGQRNLEVATIHGVPKSQTQLKQLSMHLSCQAPSHPHTHKHIHTHTCTHILTIHYGSKRLQLNGRQSSLNNTCSPICHGPVGTGLCQWSWLSFKIFLIETIFKVFIEFVTTLVLPCIGVFWPRGTWDLCSLTRKRAHSPLHWKAKP